MKVCMKSLMCQLKVKELIVEWSRWSNVAPSGGLVTWRMGESEMTRRIYKGGVDAAGVRGRLPIKWEDRLLANLRKKGIGD